MGGVGLARGEAVKSERLEANCLYIQNVQHPSHTHSQDIPYVTNLSLTFARTPPLEPVFRVSTLQPREAERAGRTIVKACARVAKIVTIIGFRFSRTVPSVDKLMRV